MKGTEIVKVLEEFKEHYDLMDKKAWEKDNDRLSDYANAMWMMCNKLSRTIRKADVEDWKTEDLSMDDLGAILNAWKTKYAVKLMETSQSIYHNSAVEAYRSLMDACEKLEQRLRTKFRNCKNEAS